jgi:hypothetical protein
MAEIVQSLFGVSPEMYQRQQQDRADAQALRFAQLDPFQQANFAIGRGANMLGGAIGGALGGQDPELQRITLRQQIASQIDFTDPASIQQGMNALGDDVMGKQQLAQIYRQQQESGALIAQRTAAATRERAPTGDVAKGMRVNEITRALQTPEISALERIGLEAELNSLSPAKAKEPTTPEITNAAAFAATKGEPGTPAYTAAFQSKFNELIAPKEAKGPSFGTDREAVAATMFDNKTYAELTPAQKAEVNKAVDESKKSVAAAGAPRLPGEPVKTKDWMDFTQNVLSKDPVMLRTSTILSDAPAAIETIRLSASNDIAANALPGSLARLTGEGKNMSNADVARFARTGGLDDRLAQDVVKFFSGRTTNVKKEQAERFATALYRGALIERRKKLVDESDQYGYLDSPNYKIALRQIDDQLARFKLAPKPGAADAPAGTPPAGGLSAAEQAELDQLRSRYRRNPQ